MPSARSSRGAPSAAGPGASAYPAPGMGPEAVDSVEDHVDSLLRGNKDSLDNISSTLAASHDISADTTAKLEQQAETLERIDKHVSSMNNTLSLTQRMLNGIKSVTSSIGNAFSSAPAPADHTLKARQARGEAPASAAPAAAGAAAAGAGPSAGAGRGSGRSSQELRDHLLSSSGQGKGAAAGADPAADPAAWVWGGGADAPAAGSAYDTEAYSSRSRRPNRGGSNSLEPGAAAAASGPGSGGFGGGFGGEDAYGSSGSGSAGAGAGGMMTADRKRQVMARIQQAREEEDSRLADVSEMMEALKLQAKTINGQLVRQGEHLDHISREVTRADDNMRGQTKQIDRIIR